MVKNVLDVNLFGSPTVMLNGKQIKFPVRKSEAMLYYLIMNKRAERSDLVYLLWGDLDESTGKKNLRNAIYKLKKEVDFELIKSVNKNVVELNKELSLKIDIDTFLKDEAEVEIYRGEFLKGFYLKDNDVFEEWLFEMREKYRSLYVNRLKKRIEEKTASSEDREGYLKRLISVDPYNEKYYRVLMMLFLEKDEFNKALEIYNNLELVLDRDLGIMPDSESENLKKQVISEREKYSLIPVAEEKKSGLFGREEQIERLIDNYSKYKKNQPFKHTLILGEAGIGKTRLLQEFRDIVENDAFIINVEVFQIEKSYIFKPWYRIFEQINRIIQTENIEIKKSWRRVIAVMFPTFEGSEVSNDMSAFDSIESIKYSVVEDTIVKLLKRISEKRKLIFLVDDLQWMDKMSLDLIHSVILNSQSQNIYFMMTSRLGYGKDVETFIALTRSNRLIESIEIQRFNREDVRRYVEDALLDIDVTEEEVDKIYEETEGNTYFLVEYINSIREFKETFEFSKEMKDVIKSRFVDISDDGKKLLNLMSMFTDNISIELLNKVSSKDVFEILEIIENLKQRNIVKEVESNNKISFRFTHQKMRDLIYMEQSAFGKKIFHGKIAEAIEQSLKNALSDRMLYPNLIFHYKSAGDYVKTLKYQILNGKTYLDFNHEMYPETRVGYSNIEGKLLVSNETTLKLIGDVEKYLRVVETTEIQDNTELETIKIEFLHMKGRYLISEGNYREGVACIEEALNISRRLDNRSYEVKCYLQLIFQCIQTNDVKRMEGLLAKAIDLAERMDYVVNYGILLRLKGLHLLLVDRFDEAEIFTKQSISHFEQSDVDSYVKDLNIAAALNYMGEIFRSKKDYEKALASYERAIELTNKHNTIKGISVFYSNAGRCLYELERLDEAESYFKRSLKVYDLINLSWSRSIVESYLAVIYAQTGRFETSKRLIKNAERHCEQFQNPKNVSLVYKHQATIRSMMDEDDCVREVFSDYLKESVTFYSEKSDEILRRANVG